MSYNNDENDIENINDKRSLCLICNDNYKTISDPETREVICVKCGKVLSDEKNDECPSPRIYEEINNVNGTAQAINNELMSHNTSNILPYNIQSPTIIGRTNVDATGRKIGTDMENIINKLRVLEKRTRYNNATDRNLKYAFEQLNKLKYKLGISDAIIKKSFYFYKKAQSLGIVRGRTIDGIVSASIYLACKEFERPTTLKEISKATNVKIRTISHYYRILVVELGLETVPVIDPMKCIIKITNKMNLNESTERKAIQIMADVKRNKIHEGKNPIAIAASTVYVACKIDEDYNDKKGKTKTQREFAKSTGISDSVLRKWYNDIVYTLNLKSIK